MASKQKTEREELNRQLLNHEFSCDNEFFALYNNAKTVARHYCVAENAVAVLSNMPLATSYICYGRLGERLGLGNAAEEVESIWEKKLMDRIHPDDMVEKIAWELQFLSFVNEQPAEQKSDYYLQHFIRMRDAQGFVLNVRHRIFYLEHDARGNVRITLCLYTAAHQHSGASGIVCSLDDTLVSHSSINIQTLLTAREREILELTGQGKASKQIAELLHISINTVNNHRQHIMRKLLCQNTAEAIAVAGKLGLLGTR